MGKVTLSRKGWDMGVSYEELKEEIIKGIKEIKDKEGIKALTRLAYLITYAIQLRNGARISEAVEAFNKFLRNEYVVKEGKKVAEVRVRKKKALDTRELIYPEFIPYNLIDKLRKFRIDVRVGRAKSYCRRILGVNTHSLRYARITYLLNRGVNPSLVAKITHHSKLDFILEYTQQKQAEKLNSEIY